MKLSCHYSIMALCEERILNHSATIVEEAKGIHSTSLAMRSLSILLGLFTTCLAPARSANNSSSSSSGGSGFDGSSSDDGVLQQIYCLFGLAIVVVISCLFIAPVHTTTSIKYQKLLANLAIKHGWQLEFQIAETLDSSAYIHLMVRDMAASHRNKYALGRWAVLWVFLRATDYVSITRWVILKDLSSTDWYGRIVETETNAFLLFNFMGYYVLVKSFTGVKIAIATDFPAKVVIGFLLTRRFDLSGANTNQCSGDTLWTGRPVSPRVSYNTTLF
jgi:hypothetical protein